MRAALCFVGFALVTVPGCGDKSKETKNEKNEVTLTDANFDTEVLRSDQPVMVDFGFEG